jgi:predicted permease
MSIRTALGAGRWQLARQLLCEGLLLSVTGGVLGLLLAHWGLELITRIGFGGLPRMRELEVDGNVLAFSFAVSVVTGIAFGLAPLLSVGRDVSAESLKESGTSVTSGRSTGWLRHTLIASEIAAAAILLAGSLLLARSFLKLQEVPVGFQPGNLILASVTIPAQRYDTHEKANAFHARALADLRAIPGVRSAGFTTSAPFSGGGTTSSYTLVDFPTPPNEAGPHGNIVSVDRDYLRTLGVPLVRGRFFDETDTLGKPLAAIIDQYMAERYFRDRDPIGRQLRLGAPDSPAYTIVGVVGTIRQGDLAEPIAKETIYFSSEQNPNASVVFALRTDLPPTSLVPQIRDAIRRIDSELPVFDVRTMEERIELSLTARRAPLTLLMGFGAVALTLAAVGIYGIIAFSVSQRTREIGIRMALGAERADILRLILRQGLKLLLIGVSAGLLVSLAGGRLLASQLYGVAAHDAISLGLAALIVSVATFLGCWLPARRATRVNPITALRTD